MPAWREPTLRFWEKVEGGDYTECWMWVGRIDRLGYGSFYESPQRRFALSHRYAYEHLRADIPAGCDLDHLCRNRACVNPWHLEPVSHSENVLRGLIARGKAAHQRCPDHRLVTIGGGRRYCRACNRENARKVAMRRKMREAEGQPRSS